MILVDEINPKAHYTIKETCALLDVNRKTLDRWYHAGHIRKHWHKISGKPFFLGADIRKFALSVIS